MTRPFLKWAGNKYALLPSILPLFNRGGIYLEPFAGSAAVFMNVEFDEYRISDINPDLINLYKSIQDYQAEFIDYAETLFTKDNNSEDRYYDYRDEFNNLEQGFERSALFIYLNRHCYNGLCRYNSKGDFNVPFGRYVAPRFPRAQLEVFAQKAKRATFQVKTFREALKNVPKESEIYVDPPYLPLDQPQTFTAYFEGGFSIDDHQELAERCRRAARDKNANIVLSNHDTRKIRSLYAGAKFIPVSARRTISCVSSSRVHAKEILVKFSRG